MGSRIKLMVLLLVASLCVAACSHDKEQAKQASPSAGTAEKQAVAPPPEILPVNGKVLEVIDAGGFTYVSLDWKGKQVWAAVPPVDLKVGEVVSLDHATMFKGFRSNALNRTFDELIFASDVVGKAPRSRAANSANPKEPGNQRFGKAG